MPRKPKSNVSDDVLKANPAYAEELESGDWSTEAEVKRGKGADKKNDFLHAWHEFAPGAPEPVGHVKEFMPIPGKRNRCDWAWPDWKIIVEVDGGNMGVRQIKKGRNRGRWIPTGRHTKDADYWKINEITALGYAVFRFTTTQLKNRATAEECVYQVLYFMRSKGFIK